MILRIVIFFAALSTLFKQHKIYVTPVRNTGHRNRTKKLLDKLCQPYCHKVEAICLTSQSVQVKMTRKLV
ncbi:MAG: hypothetical protein LBU56_02815, partial [Rickettsiales bacterium]|nr:hypothetical protein [Rickettsiales bacterium]